MSHPIPPVPEPAAHRTPPAAPRPSASLGYRRLAPEQIVETARALASRVEERFPGSGLAGVAGELTAVAAEAHGRLAAIAKPNWPLRALAVAGTALLVAGLAAAVGAIPWSSEVAQWPELVQGVEAAINDVVFLAVGLFFVFTLESRLKRRKVLAALHELRSLAHIVDMHQLTKDPEQVLEPAMARTRSSPLRTMSRFELSRYLDYCSELLALIGKVAALHAQDLRDPVVLAAVNDVEVLSVGIANKVWQKIMIIDEIRLRAGEVAGGAVALPGDRAPREVP